MILRVITNYMFIFGTGNEDFIEIQPFSIKGKISKNSSHMNNTTLTISLGNSINSLSLSILVHFQFLIMVHISLFVNTKSESDLSIEESLPDQSFGVYFGWANYENFGTVKVVLSIGWKDLTILPTNPKREIVSFSFFYCYVCIYCSV